MISLRLPYIIRDSRERDGYNFRKTVSCAGMKVKKLDYGDYTLEGLEDYVIIERKNSIDELCSCLGKQRDRFMRELDRMDHVKYKFIIVEGYWSDIYKRHRFTRMHPNAILGNLFSIMMRRGIHIIFGGTKKRAQQFVRWILRKAYKYWLEDQNGNNQA